MAHAQAAARRAARVAVVREAYGVAAYYAGEYGRAITELKAAARISGSNEYLPMIADCERGLERPERALALASSPEATTLDRAGKVEMLIVASGARRDLGQPEAAVLTLQVPALKSREPSDWLARLRYAYADALLAVGRKQEARRWFGLSADVDLNWVTEAQERLDELDGLVFDEEAQAGAALDPDPAGDPDPAPAVAAPDASETQSDPSPGKPCAGVAAVAVQFQAPAPPAPADSREDSDHDVAEAGSDAAREQPQEDPS